MSAQGKSQRPTLHSDQLAGVFGMAAHVHVSEYALTIGMAGVGLTLSVKDLRGLGLKPFAVAAGAALVVVSSSWLLTSFLRH
jgi:uncharacterized membrane protein YadS